MNAGHRGRKYFKHQENAFRFIARFMAVSRMDDLKQRVSKENKSDKIGGLASLYLAHLKIDGLSEDGIKQARACLKRFVLTFGDLTPDKVTGDDIDDWVERLDYSTRTFVAFLKKLYTEFVEFMRRAKLLDQAFKDGKIDAEFERYLMGKVGLSDANMIEREVNRIEGETGKLEQGRVFSIRPAGFGVRKIRLEDVPEPVQALKDPFSNIPDNVGKNKWGEAWYDWLKNNPEWGRKIDLPGESIKLSSKTKSKLSSASNSEDIRLHFIAASHLPELLENSVLAAVHEDTKNNKGVEEVHRRYSWMDFPNGERHGILMTIFRWKENVGVNHDTAYNTEVGLEVEKNPLGATRLAQQGNLERSSQSPSGQEKLEQFMSIVKPEHNFLHQSPNTSLSIRARDEAYDAAVKAGDEAEQQRLVDEAAKEAGYTVKASHGSSARFNEFSHEFGGYATDAKSAKGAFFFSDGERTPKAYAVYAAEEGPVKDLMRKADQAEARGDWDAYEKYILQAEEMVYGEQGADATFKRRENATIYNTYLKGRFLEMDAEGKTPAELSQAKQFEEFDGSITAALKDAKNKGYDGRQPHFFGALGGRMAAHHGVMADNEGGYATLAQVSAFPFLLTLYTEESISSNPSLTATPLFSGDGSRKAFLRNAVERELYPSFGSLGFQKLPHSVHRWVPMERKIFMNTNPRRRNARPTRRPKNAAQPIPSLRNTPPQNKAIMAPTRSGVVTRTG